MSTQCTPVADDTIYTIVINEQQRRILHAAMLHYSKTADDDECSDTDWFGSHVVDLLTHRLDNMSGSLTAQSIDNFTL